MSTAPVPSPRRARVRMAIGAVLVLLLVGLGCAVLVAALSSPGAAVTIGGDLGDGESASGPGGGTEGGDEAPLPGAEGRSPGVALYVHVLGQVEAPGLYQLSEGARVVDVIAAAGGLTDEADTGAVNLARFVSDGEQLVVPAVGEAPDPAAGGAGGGGPPASGTVGGLVDINTADAATLETLPRIGPAMAQRIIEWRDANGRFASTDELMNVTGIGDRTFEGLRDLVTV